jgi:UBX domain
MNLNQFAKYQSHLKSAYDRNEFLMTKSLKDKQESERLSKIKSCIVRIRLPDQSYIEGTFSGDEKLYDVYHFIEESLRQELVDKASFDLFMTPPKHYLKESNQRLIADLKFGPRNILHLEWNGPSPGAVSEIFKENIFATAKPITEAEDVKRDRINDNNGDSPKNNRSGYSTGGSGSKGILSKPKWMKLSK